MIGFLLSLPFLALLVFGTMEVSELLFRLGAAQQASYFAARSEFVGADAHASAQHIARFALAPVTTARGMAGLQSDQRRMNVRATNSKNTRIMYVEIAPDFLAPSLSRPMLGSVWPSTLAGSTQVPKRSPP